MGAVRGARVGGRAGVLENEGEDGVVGMLAKADQRKETERLE